MKLSVNGMFVILLISLLLVRTEASFRRRYYKDSAHPGKCVINSNLILSPGDTAEHPNMQCALILCGQNGIAETKGCPAEISLRNCKLGAPKFPNAEYPICCPRRQICATQQDGQPVDDLTI